MDWEKFLRVTGLDDGDERETAIADLLEAEEASGGLFVIDRDPRTQAEIRIRLKRDGGEAWLFGATGMVAPSDEREALVAWLREARDLVVPDPYATGWDAWLRRLSSDCVNGASVTPFKRDGGEENRNLLEALVGVLNWRGESLIRYASAVICRDSKMLERLRPRLLAALREITGIESITLGDFGISDVPRSVWIHGPLILESPRGRIDFGVLSGPVSVSEEDIAGASDVICEADSVLTVENESVFRELAKQRCRVLLIQTSFPGSAVRRLFDRFPRELPCYHFGDSDPAGFAILRDLREKTNRRIAPVMMCFRDRENAPALTEPDRRMLERLLEDPTLEDLHEQMRAMDRAGTKGDFEQELIPPDLIWGSLP